MNLPLLIFIEVYSQRATRMVVDLIVVFEAVKSTLKIKTVPQKKGTDQIGVALAPLIPPLKIRCCIKARKFGVRYPGHSFLLRGPTIGSHKNIEILTD